MSEKEKIVALIDYLCDACKYTDSYKSNAVCIMNGKATYPRPITHMASHLTYNKSGLPETAGKSIALR